MLPAVPYRTRRSLRPGSYLQPIAALLLENVEMAIVIGPVLSRADGYAFDTWSTGKGLTRSYPYRRIDQAYYARNARSRHLRRVAGRPRSSARPSTT